ncbi:hypothetical protein BGLA2_750004 [Burkholderia gladioli]|nr:hypothetical protein BGLA2_750004 [Burkholderia gladioli]
MPRRPGLSQALDFVDRAGPRRRGRRAKTASRAASWQSMAVLAVAPAGARRHFTALNAARESCRFWLGIPPY